MPTLKQPQRICSKQGFTLIAKRYLSKVLCTLANFLIQGALQQPPKNKSRLSRSPTANFHKLPLTLHSLPLIARLTSSASLASTKIAALISAAECNQFLNRTAPTRSRYPRYPGIFNGTRFANEVNRATLDRLIAAPAH